MVDMKRILRGPIFWIAGTLHVAAFLLIVAVIRTVEPLGLRERDAG